MANKARGEVSFEAFDETWTMKVDTNAMCEIEDQTGVGIAKVGALLSNPETASIKLLRAVLWGSLQSKHPGTSLKKAGDLIDAVGMSNLGPLVGQAFSAAFPKANKEAGDKANPQKATAE